MRKIIGWGAALCLALLSLVLAPSSQASTAAKYTIAVWSMPSWSGPQSPVWPQTFVSSTPSADRTLDVAVPQDCGTQYQVDAYRTDKLPKDGLPTTLHQGDDYGWFDSGGWGTNYKLVHNPDCVQKPSFTAEVTCGSITFTGINPTKFAFAADFRVDSEAPTNDYGTGPVYEIVNLPAGGEPVTKTVTFAEDSGVHTVMYRIILGAEQDWYQPAQTVTVQSDCHENQTSPAPSTTAPSTPPSTTETTPVHPSTTALASSPAPSSRAVTHSRAQTTPKLSPVAHRTTERLANTGVDSGLLGLIGGLALIVGCGLVAASLMIGRRNH
jgi:hypothetical protein